MTWVNEGWFGIVSGALIGFAISYFFYKRSRREPRLCEKVVAVRVLDRMEARLAEEVAISYKGESVPRLAVATVYLWNAGNETLHGAALIPLDPVRATVQGEGRILNAQIERNPRPACNAQVRVDDSLNSVSVAFDFLDPGDGFSVRVLHTGAKAQVRIDGSLKGVKRVVADGRPATWGDVGLAVLRVFTPLFAVFGLILLRGLLAPYYTRPTWLPVWAAWAAFFMLLIAVFWQLSKWVEKSELPMPRGLTQQ